MLNKDEIYVCHMDVDVLCVGTKQECQEYKDSQTFRTDSWQVSSLEGYGSLCYYEGRNCGYNEGRDFCID